MGTVGAEVRRELKEAGKLLSHPPASVDDLLHLLDQVEKLLVMVDQSPNASMQEALKPSMSALVKESLLRHSNIDVKVAVASCISEIMRITAPEAPYSDGQMKDVFELIVSSFENISDESSRSYNKRASILETASKVRSCVIMLDLECDGLILDMFQHFLNSVRDHHPESTFLSMMEIMALVLEESEDVSVDLVKTLLASVKNDSGVLPVARKLGEGVLRKSAAKLRPYLIQTLQTSGDSLENYSRVLASVCEESNVVDHDEDASGPLQADESKLAKDSSDEAPQADESKITRASSDNVNQVVIENAKEAKIEPTSHRSPKSVMHNGITFSENEEASKKLEEANSHPHSNPNDSGAHKLANVKSNPGKTSKRGGKKSDAPMNSVKPSDGKKESEKLKLPDNERSILGVHSSPPSETEEKTDDQIAVAKPIESEAANAPPSESDRPKKNDLNHDDEPVLVKAPEGKSDLDIKPRKRARKKAPVAKHYKLPAATATAMQDAEATTGSDLEPQKTASKKADTADSGAKSAKQLNKGNKAGAEEPQAKKPKQSDKKLEAGELDAMKLMKSDKKAETGESDAKKVKDSDKKLEAGESDAKKLKKSDEKPGAGESDAKKLKKSDKKPESGESDAKKLKKSDKKLEAIELSAKKQKPAGKKVDVGDEEGKPSEQGESNSDDKPLIQSGNKPSELNNEPEYDSDTKPLRQSAKRVNKLKKIREITNPSGASANKREGTDLETKAPSAKKGNTSTSKCSPKKNKDGKKGESGENLDEIDISPKSAEKSAKGEDNSVEALSTTSKRKRTAGKSKVTKAIKYDKSLVGLKVKVWWPEDKTFYEGVIASFDSKKKTHQVSYLDGDMEILNLKEEKWEILQEFSACDEVKAPEVETVVAFPEIEAATGSPEMKKPGTDSEPSASQEKAKDLTKQGDGASKSACKIDQKSEEEAEGGILKEEDEKKSDANGSDKPKSGSKSGKIGSKKRKRS